MHFLLPGNVLTKASFNFTGMFLGFVIVCAHKFVSHQIYS